MEQLTRLVALFKQHFRAEPEIAVRAPGRVNLLGEHTDYTGGLVLPVAIDKDMIFLCRRRKDKGIGLFSADFDKLLNLKEVARQSSPDYHWANYVLGVAYELVENDFALGGFDALVAGTIPLGAGLASSAALEVATAVALKELFKLKLGPVLLVTLCQAAENQFVSVNCGIMDQFTSYLAKKDHAISINCDTLKYNHVPLDPKQVSIAVCHTGIKHELAFSAYNKRVQECNEGLGFIQKHNPRILKLGNATEEILNIAQKEMPPTIANRCKHVIMENQRVRKGIEALSKGDIESFGRLMYESHQSLKELYQVSCPELDYLVDATQSIDGVFGCKMTGAGFGGAVVALVRQSALDGFQDHLKMVYNIQTGKEPQIFICNSADGASIIKCRIS